MPANVPYVEFAKDIKATRDTQRSHTKPPLPLHCQSAPELKDLRDPLHMYAPVPLCDERPTRLLDRGSGESGILIKAARISDFIV